MPRRLPQGPAADCQIMTHIAAGTIAAGLPFVGSPYLAMPGPTELWIVLGVVLLIFGGRKLPELARAAGSSITQFKRGLKDEEVAEPIEGPAGEAEKETT